MEAFDERNCVNTSDSTIYDKQYVISTVFIPSNSTVPPTNGTVPCTNGSMICISDAAPYGYSHDRVSRALALAAGVSFFGLQ